MIERNEANAPDTNSVINEGVLRFTGHAAVSHSSGTTDTYLHICSNYRPLELTGTGRTQVSMHPVRLLQKKFKLISCYFQLLT